MHAAKYRLENISHRISISYLFFFFSRTIFNLLRNYIAPSTRLTELENEGSENKTKDAFLWIQQCVCLQVPRHLLRRIINWARSLRCQAPRTHPGESASLAIWTDIAGAVMAGCRVCEFDGDIIRGHAGISPSRCGENVGITEICCELHSREPLPFPFPSLLLMEP